MPKYNDITVEINDGEYIGNLIGKIANAMLKNSCSKEDVKDFHRAVYFNRTKPIKDVCCDFVVVKEKRKVDR